MDGGICGKESYREKEFVEEVGMFEDVGKKIIGGGVEGWMEEVWEVVGKGKIVEVGELGFLRS